MSQQIIPFDPHGVAPENLIENETKTLVRDGRTYRLFIPTCAPFYAKDFELKLNNVKLVEGVDYILTHRFTEMINAVAQEVCGAFWITSESVHGNMSYTYRSVGSNYTVDTNTADTYLTANPSPVEQTWEDVMGGSRYIAPTALNYDRDSFIGADILNYELKEFEQGLIKMYADADVWKEPITAWYNEIRSYVNSNPDKHHASRQSNVHNVNPIDVNGLLFTGVALDTTKLFNLTETGYVNEVNNTVRYGLNKENIDGYGRDEKNKLNNDVILKDHLAFITLGTSSEQTRFKTMLDLSGGVYKLISPKPIVFAADNNGDGNGTLQILSVDDSLIGYSRNNTLSDDAFEYNGETIVTTANIENIVGNITQLDADVTSNDTATTTIIGDGSTAEPLEVHINIVAANTITAGMAKLVSDVNSTSQTDFATPSLVDVLVKSLANKIPTERTVNNIPLVQNVNISKVELGLGNVDNISDADMPVNSNHRSLLSGKALKSHTHTLTDMNVQHANVSRRGLFRLTYDESETGEGYTVSSMDLSIDYVKAVEIENIVDSALPVEAINVQRFSDDGMDIELDGNNIIIKSEQRYYVKGKFYTLPTATLTPELPLQIYTNYYLYVHHYDNTEVGYLLTPNKLANSETRLEIGKCYLGHDGFDSYNVETVLSIGNIRELTDHIESKIFHGLDCSNITKVDIGLPDVENKPVATELSDPTLTDIFTKGHKFSHSKSTTNLPANENDFNKFNYHLGSNSIYTNGSTETFVGAISPEYVDDYEISVRLSSTDTKGDPLGLILGYVEEGGREHTLSVIVNGNINSSDFGRVAVNYDQFDQHDIIIRSISSGANKFTWSSLGAATLTAKRVGDIITITIDAFENLAELGGWSTIVNLNSNVATHKFKGKTKYGYCLKGQDEAAITSLKKPGKNPDEMYASRKLFSKAYGGLDSYELVGTLSADVDNTLLNELILPANADKSKAIVTATVLDSRFIRNGWFAAYKYIDKDLNEDNIINVAFHGYGTDRASDSDNDNRVHNIVALCKLD